MKLDMITDTIHERERGVLEDETLTDRDALELKKYADLASDMEYRNSQGAEPLRKYIDAISALSTKEDIYSWICSTELNPLGTSMLSLSEMQRSDADPDRKPLMMTHPSLSLMTAGPENVYINAGSKLPDLKVKVDNKVIYVLSRLGYTEEQARDILRRCYAFEKKIACTADIFASDDEADVTRTFEELVREANGYPLEKYFDSRGYTKPVTAVADVVYIRAMDGLCSDIEGFRAMAAVQYILSLGMYLDSDTISVFIDNSNAMTKAALSDPDKTSEQLNDLMLFDYYRLYRTNRRTQIAQSDFSSDWLNSTQACWRKSRKI